MSGLMENSARCWGEVACVGKWVTCNSNDETLLTAQQREAVVRDPTFKGVTFTKTIWNVAYHLCSISPQMHIQPVVPESAGPCLLFQSRSLWTLRYISLHVLCNEKDFWGYDIMSSHGDHSKALSFPVFLQLQGLCACSALLLRWIPQTLTQLLLQDRSHLGSQIKPQ